jgi:hypothetical protein
MIRFAKADPIGYAANRETPASSTPDSTKGGRAARERTIQTPRGQRQRFEEKPQSGVFLLVEDVKADAGDAKKHRAGQSYQNRHHATPGRGMWLFLRDYVVRQQQRQSWHALRGGFNGDAIHDLRCATILAQTADLSGSWHHCIGVIAWANR